MDGIVTREDAMDFVSRNWQDLLLGALVVGLGGALLAAFAFTRPAERTETRFVPYEHVTTFEYTAQAPPEVVYDGAEPEPGEPVFRAVSDELSVEVGYQLQSAEPAALHGRYSLVARISNDDGWERTLSLVEPTPFEGGKFTAAARLPLADVESVIRRFEETTGVVSREYTLAIEARVELEGTLAGQPFRQELTPTLPFVFQPLQLVLDRPATGENPLEQHRQEMLEVPRSVANTLPIFAWDAPVTTARVLAGILLGLGLAVGGFIAVGLAWRGDGPQSPEHVSLRYRARLVEAKGDPAAAALKVTDVGTLDDLARVAERLDTVILYWVHRRGVVYAVTDGPHVYRFEIAATAMPRELKGERAA